MPSLICSHLGLEIRISIRPKDAPSERLALVFKRSCFAGHDVTHKLDFARKKAKWTGERKKSRVRGFDNGKDTALKAHLMARVDVVMTGCLPSVQNSLGIAPQLPNTYSIGPLHGTNRLAFYMRFRDTYFV